VKKLSEWLFLFALGGTIYYSFEMFFRQMSHWSMFVLGGLCMVFIAQQGLWVEWKDPLWKQLLRCMVFVISGEFLTGILVNKWLQWEVWDYTDQPFQFMGQICLPFAIIFSGICVIGIFLAAYLLYWLYGEVKPSFHVL
jgi:uncharacterized membrane protein